ncbi:MAG: hypothetical protein ACRCTG_10915 [Aestuariivirga sp.]
MPVVPLSLESLLLGPDDPPELPELPELPESLLAPDDPPEPLPLFPPLLPLLPPPPPLLPPLLLPLLPPPPVPELPPPDACAWLMFMTAGATYTAVASSPSFLMISRRSMRRPPILFSLKSQDCVILPDRNLTRTGKSSSWQIYRIFSLMNR